MVFAAEEYCNSVRNQVRAFVHFQHGGHKPEVVISLHLQHLALHDRVRFCSFCTW